MKKILAILALISSGTVYAASATIQYQNIDNVNSTDSTGYILTVRENISKNLIGDVQFSQTSRDGTGQISSTRVEFGLTPSYKFGNTAFYSRITVGEKFTSSNSFGFYSIEPGLVQTLGSSGFKFRLGYRYRNAFDTNNDDQTRTVRVGLSYDLTKKDTVGIRFDRVKGDSDQKTTSLTYTRNF